MKKIFIILILPIAATVSFAQSPAEQQALELARAGNTQQAIAAFEKILSANTSNVNAMNVLAQLYLQTGKAKEAYDLSSQALRINPADENQLINKGKAAIMLGKPDEAAALMDTAIAKQPSFFMFYAVKANALDEQNKIQLAIGMYTKSIQLAPDYAPNYYFRGVDFASISRYPQAIQDYSKAIELQLGSGDAYNMRGMAWYHSGKTTQALEDYNQAIRNGNKDALVNRGVLYKEQEQTALAKADFMQAINIHAGSASDAWFHLADIQVTEQAPEKATQSISNAIALQPNNAAYRALQAKIYLAARRDTEGLAAAEKALTLQPENHDAIILKTTALSNLKRFDEAIKTITAGITQYPGNQLMYSLRAYVYKLQGKLELAAADETKARQLGNQQP